MGIRKYDPCNGCQRVQTNSSCLGCGVYERELQLNEIKCLAESAVKVSAATNRLTLGKKGAPILQVIRWVKDGSGKAISTLMLRYDGSKEDARAKAESLSALMFTLHPEASDIQSQIGATGENGEPKFVISPNFKRVMEVGDLKAAG